MGRVLVTGATGNVGRAVVGQLVAAGIAVRALVRDPEAADLPAQVEVAQGDLAEPRTLKEPLRDVDTVFLIWPFLTTDGAAALLAVIAEQAGRAVYLSSSGVADDATEQTDPINQVHAGLERLVDASGLAWTVLRSDTIASNALGWAAQIRSSGVVRGPEIAPTAVIHERDVAAVAARVLVDDAHAGSKYVLTGPQILGRADQIALIGQAVGRSLRFESMPEQVARRQLLADGRPPALVEALLASARNRPRSSLVTSAVEDLTGTPPQPFTAWAQQHAGYFR